MEKKILNEIVCKTQKIQIIIQTNTETYANKFLIMNKIHEKKI